MPYEEHLTNVLDLIGKYQNLVDCHLVDFITEDLWDKFVPSSMKLELEGIASQDPKTDWWKTELSSELNSFKKLTESLKLSNCPEVINFNSLTSMISKTENRERNTVPLKQESFFMKNKKWHEIDRFSKAIAHFMENDFDLIIDAGSGKAYLSQYLSEVYGIPALAIESSTSHYNSALLRKDLIHQKYGLSFPKVCYVNESINEMTDYSSLIDVNFLDGNNKNNAILVGLHTCGNLTHAMCKSFIYAKDIKCLCIVPCCYHLITNSFTIEPHFSRNARMLAQQSLERISCKTEPMCEKLFYRAILQVLLRSLEIDDVKIGRGGPSSDFPNYANWALNKVGVSSKQIPSKECLEHMYKTYVAEQWKLEVFHMLRMYLAPVVEAAIVLDMATFLKQSNDSLKPKIIQLFDPAVSPRNYAIIATK
ncbi:methyltransferase-like protein 25 [Leptopilina heterotoma]|uniref:methyltransferase-like protein 25 n=1 Tax=Leptopilina heterotoma TaxID=63436 RepID=UPI001CA7C831|nr:methyltransferase-like protein 25 [Leptopilina heterotoma]